DLEEVAQLATTVAAAEAVGAQCLQVTRYPLTDLVSEELHVVGGGNHRTATAGQVLLDIAQTLGFGRMQAVPALHGQAIAAQFVEAGHAADVRADAVVVLKNAGRLSDFAHDGATSHQLDVMISF